jgi:hypothetical protein
LSLRIAGAGQRRKPPGFYEKVAARCRQLVEDVHDRHPAKTIAGANGLKVASVHAWIKACRQRGLLGQAYRAGQRDERPLRSRLRQALEDAGGPLKDLTILSGQRDIPRRHARQPPRRRVEHCRW